MTQLIEPGPQTFCESSKEKQPCLNRISWGKSLSCGCRRCALLCTVGRLALIGPGIWIMSREEIVRRLRDVKLHDFKPGFGRSEWVVHNGDVFTYLDCIECFLLKEDSILRGAPVIEPHPGFTGSDKSIQTAKMWLENCLNNHKDCCASYQRQMSPPKRILDLEGISGDGVRLLEDSEEITHYMCLSHCWGDPANHPLKTTTHNLSLHKAGIAFAELPKSFQEAVILVRRLGFRYLWIDSLCIIQDDKNDWRVQASRMADIYQGAVLTIAADAAQDSTKGLFKHLPSEFQGVLLSDLTGNGEYNHVWVRQTARHGPELLDTRGWVFQERVLSPRTLSFGEHELAWECLQDSDCECGYGMRPSELPRKNIHPSRVHIRNKSALYLRWTKAVEQYSKLHLSHEADIFPAISGIAKYFAIQFQSRYIAGLWSENMIRCLHWQISTSKYSSTVPTRRPKKWRAPTFSWASLILSQDAHMINWAVEYGRYKPCGEVIEACSVPVGADDTGQISDAHIDLKGNLIKGVISETDDPACRWTVTDEGKNFQSCKVYADYEYSVHGKDQVVSGDEIFCFKISELWIKDPDWIRCFLLLRRVERAEGAQGRPEDTVEPIPTYERIGFIRESGCDELGNIVSRLVDFGEKDAIVRII